MSEESHNISWKTETQKLKTGIELILKMFKAEIGDNPRKALKGLIE